MMSNPNDRITFYLGALLLGLAAWGFWKLLF